MSHNISVYRFEMSNEVPLEPKVILEVIGKDRRIADKHIIILADQCVFEYTKFLDEERLK